MRKLLLLVVIVVAAFFLLRGGEEKVADEIISETDTYMDTGNPTVVLKTTMGEVSIEIFKEEAPITANNFLDLVKEGFYDGIKFHRVIPDFMAQGGDPKTKDDSLQGEWGTGGSDTIIQDEFAPGLSNVRGTISMANSGPNTGSSQFFLNVNDNLFLDGKHAVFGKITSGLEIVDAMTKVKTEGVDPFGNPLNRPAEAIVIERATIQ